MKTALAEGDADAALGEAKAGGCTEHQWLQLAQALEAGRPEEAATIYRARIEPMVARTGNRAYDEAAALIARVKALMRRTGREERPTPLGSTPCAPGTRRSAISSRASNAWGERRWSVA